MSRAYGMTFAILSGERVSARYAADLRPHNVYLRSLLRGMSLRSYVRNLSSLALDLTSEPLCFGTPSLSSEINPPVCSSSPGYRSDSA